MPFHAPAVLCDMRAGSDIREMQKPGQKVVKTRWKVCVKCGRGTRAGWHWLRQSSTEDRSSEAVECLCVQRSCELERLFVIPKTNKQRGLGERLTVHGLLSRREWECHAFGRQEERQQDLKVGMKMAKKKNHGQSE